jgi:hypothetical protein
LLHTHSLTQSYIIIHTYDIQRIQMTAIGRFSMQTETIQNPSIVTFFMTLSGPVMAATDFVQLWKDRDMPGSHPRFHSTVSPHRAGYFQQHHDDSHGDSQDKKERNKSWNANDMKRSQAALADFLTAHITETLYPISETARKDLTARIIDLQTVSWPLTDSLWHVYVGSDSKKSSASRKTRRTKRPSFLPWSCFVATTPWPTALPWARRSWICATKPSS